MTTTAPDRAAIMSGTLDTLDTLRDILAKLEQIRDEITEAPAPGGTIAAKIRARFDDLATGTRNYHTAEPITNPAGIDPNAIVPTIEFPRGVAYYVASVYARHNKNAPALYIAGDGFRAGTRYPFVYCHRIAAVGGSWFEQYPRGWSRAANGSPAGDYHEISPGARNTIGTHIHDVLIGTVVQTDADITAGTIEAAAAEARGEISLGAHKARQALHDAITAAGRLAADVLGDKL